uniref:Zinc finger, CCHC-type n=1 Tax=Tanacetum cinerariifolium TaxID=118510 RepID=A0A6L2NVJ0_TANCI|nr:zinc finger, CCHC-type [Tanacetum cinerariifolium]
MLKPSNYSLWAIRMQITLEANGLWEMIEPNEKTQADNKKDKTAIAFLYQALPEEQLLQITKHKTAKAIWDALKTRHIGEERVQQVRLQTLKSDFKMLHMKEDETIDTFTGKLTTLVNKAASLGHTMEDETLVHKLLNVVPDRTKPNEQSNLVEEDLEPTLLMAILEDLNEEKHVKEVKEQKVSLHEEDVGYKETNMDSLWYLDNGASNHMTRVKEHFKELDEKVSRKRNRLYKANLRIGTPVCLLANLKDDTWLWHARLGHLNFESLRLMAQRDLVYGIPAIKHTTQVCDVYLIGKHSRAPFLKKAKARSTSTLDLVYGDLCGPITPPTPSGKKYIFLLVDDYSRYMWVYFLSTKDQAFDTFKEYKKSIENELRTTLKMLRMDRGGEFTSNEFTQYCKENGIARQLTAPYSPQQNGVVERRNRKIMSTTRCMMKATNMPQNFWAKAVRHAIYILNSVPTKALEDITPYEAIKRRKPNLENLRVFGCIAYAKVPSQHLTKLDDRSSRTEYMSEHINDEPEWTDFKIRNLKVTNEHHDQGIQPIEEDNEFPNNGDDDYTSPTRDSPTHSQAPHIPSTCASQQSAYANKILKEAVMLDCNKTLIPMDPGTRLTKVTKGTMVNSTEYQSLIGYLRYLLHTRPALSYYVGLLSRFMQEPREQHMKAIRQVLRYVKGTKDYGITYKHNGGNKIHGFSDSSYGVNTQEGKGTTRIIFYYGESPISWSTQKQATVAVSSCESEFIAAATQALWLKRLLSKLTHSEEEKVTIRVDNKSAIALMKNPVFHGRTNPNIPPLCSVVVLPENSLSTLLKDVDFSNLFKLLASEVTFVLQVSDDCQQCNMREGKCSDNNQEFWCEYNKSNMKKEHPRNIVIKSALGITAVIISIVLALCLRFKFIPSPEKRSVISMSGMRGTPGYIAPEVFSRNFRGMPHKSNVYSYGMMVLEMVGGRRDVVVEDEDTSSMHFPHLIYKQLVSNRNIGLRGILNEEDKDRETKMVLVSFWCMQSDPSSRPSMSKVLDMLEGNLEEVPPKPFLFNHPRSPDFTN